MKLTRRQLRKLIREVWIKPHAPGLSAEEEALTDTLRGGDKEFGVMADELERTAGYDPSLFPSIPGYNRPEQVEFYDKDPRIILDAQAKFHDYIKVAGMGDIDQDVLKALIYAYLKIIHNHMLLAEVAIDYARDALDYTMRGPVEDEHWNLMIDPMEIGMNLLVELTNNDWYEFPAEVDEILVEIAENSDDSIYEMFGELVIDATTLDDHIIETYHDHLYN